MLEAGEEDRFIQMACKDDNMIRLLKPDQLVSRGLYKTLILLDPVVLIEVFNMMLGSGKEVRTVYDELCDRVAEGKEVEALCNVVIQVHNTFWDMGKLPKFYKALIKVFSDKKQSTEEGEHSNIQNNHSRVDEKESWLVFVQNPLLFCIKLFYFF